LQTGKVIVCIGTCALVGLEEAELETRFASCFHNDVLLHVVEWADLCATEIEHEAAMLGEWHENEDAEREQNAMFQAASPFLREQTGAVELLVTLDGEVSITALEKLRADVATSLHSSHPSLHVSPSARIDNDPWRCDGNSWSSKETRKSDPAVWCHVHG